MKYMKKILKLFVVAAFLVAPLFLLAQEPPHPGGGNPPGGGDTPVGGGAPIDGGLTVMLVLGAAYGARKVFQLRK